MTTLPVRILAFVGCTFLLAACSPRKADVVLNTTAFPPSSLLQRVTARGVQIRSLVGSGSVSFESPEMAGSVFFRVSLKKPDSLLLRFDGPFGIDAGFFFLSRASFVMYNRFENTVTSGPPDEHNIRKVIPFALSSDEILDAFAGSFALPPAVDAPVRYTIEDNQYYLEYRTSNNIRRYWIDPENDLIVRYMVTDMAGQVLVEASGERITDQDGITVPRLITVTFPGDKRRVSIFYSNIELNPSALSFAYGVPSGARKTSLRN